MRGREKAPQMSERVTGDGSVVTSLLPGDYSQVKEIVRILDAAE